MNNICDRAIRDTHLNSSVSQSDFIADVMHKSIILFAVAIAVISICSAEVLNDQGPPSPSEVEGKLSNLRFYLQRNVGRSERICITLIHEKNTRFFRSKEMG